MDALSQGLIEWGVSSRTLSGQKESGDLHLVRVFPTEALAAVVDGLGHGAGAAAAAKLAIAALEKGTLAGETAVSLIRRCHENLRSTRGVVLDLALFCASDNTMTWGGVGNIEGFLFHRQAHFALRREMLLVRSGLLGAHLPSLTAATMQVGYGDLLIFATDGIRAGFADIINWQESPQQVADRIMDQYARETDDALVLVARYLGGSVVNRAR